MKARFKIAIVIALVIGLTVIGSTAFAANAKAKDLGQQSIINAQGNSKYGMMNGNKFGILKNLNINPLLKMARILGIDTDGLTAEQIADRIKEAFADRAQKGNNHQHQFMWNQSHKWQNNNQWYINIDYIAELLDIDSDDLDRDEIIDEIIDQLDDLSAEDLLEIAEFLAIDTSDLSVSEIIDAIEDELNKNYPPYEGKIYCAAELLAIETDDLDEGEIVAEIISRLEDVSLINLLKLANILAIDTGDLTSSEIIEEIEDALIDLLD